MRATIQWHPVTEPPPECGWYLGAMLPVNHAELTEGITSWRNKFGCTKVWFNPQAIDAWWMPEPQRASPVPVGHRITHWARLPGVPPIKGHPDTARERPLDLWRPTDEQACEHCGGTGHAAPEETP